VDESIELMLGLVDDRYATPERATAYARRWQPDTLAGYAVLVGKARDWWGRWRAEARSASPVAVPDLAGTFMPWPPDRLAAYMEHLLERGAAPGTARKAKAALVAWHRLHGLPVPDGLPASEVLNRHETTRARAGRAAKRAEPLTLDVVVRVLSAIDRTGPRGRRDACLVLLAYAGMMAAPRLVGLRLADVAVQRDGLLVRGTPDLILPHWTIGGEHHTALCPVETPAGWVRYLDERGAPPESYVFRPVDQHDHVAGVDLARSGRPVGDQPMTTRGLGRVFVALLVEARIEHPERYTIQSLRRGGVVTRRLGGAGVEQLADEAGISLRSTTLLDLLRAAESWVPESTLVPGVHAIDPTEDTPC
jgi:integrase